jgi:hypothetical protein
VLVTETTSRIDQMIAEIREYEKYLDSELRRVRLLLNAADGVEIRTNTTEILLEIFQEDPAKEFTAADAERELRKRGWMTESSDAVNAVRAALSRLKNNNDVEQVNRGTYRLYVKPPQEVPWAAAPPSAKSPFDDEPPF